MKRRSHWGTWGSWNEFKGGQLRWQGGRRPSLLVRRMVRRSHPHFKFSSGVTCWGSDVRMSGANKRGHCDDLCSWCWFYQVINVDVSRDRGEASWTCLSVEIHRLLLCSPPNQVCCAIRLWLSIPTDGAASLCGLHCAPRISSWWCYSRTGWRGLVRGKGACRGRPQWVWVPF